MPSGARARRGRGCSAGNAGQQRERERGRREDRSVHPREKPTSLLPQSRLMGRSHGEKAKAVSQLCRSFILPALSLLRMYCPYAGHMLHTGGCAHGHACVFLLAGIEVD